MYSPGVFARGKGTESADFPTVIKADRLSALRRLSLCSARTVCD